MHDVLDALAAWRADGQPVALATVVETWGSAPRAAGACMAVSGDGRLAGSVSGGCVEAAVIEAAGEVLKSGTPRLLHFGVADETAWSVGLACGGQIEVFVAPLDSGLFDDLRALAQADRGAALVTLIDGPPDELGRYLLLPAEGEPRGPLLGRHNHAPLEAARAALASGRSTRATWTDGWAFVNVLRRAPTLVIVGGVHIAVALCELAHALGWRTLVVDPRPPFGDVARFPRAAGVYDTWPDTALGQIGLTSATAVAVLTHDPKLDDPALQAALPSPAFYVGALGSKATQAKRRQRLLDAGVSEEHVARLHAPIGLDLGGRTPEEIALSVMAQVIAARHGKAGAR